MPGLRVNVDNFVRAETDRMFAALLGQGELNQWQHTRVPVPLDAQTVIRMNRDTLYSTAIVDVTGGAEVSIPDAAGRYLSVMIVDQSHYVTSIIHDPGVVALRAEAFGSSYVLAAARIMVNPSDPADVAAVNGLQDQLGVTAGSARPFVPEQYDEPSLDATRNALLELGRGLTGYERVFGARQDVDPVRHLIGTAVGWGGLPEQEAFYINVDPGLPIGAYTLTVREVPVDAFWSISLYNAQGFFQPVDDCAVSISNVTAVPNQDGSVSINFGGCSDGRPNCLGIMEGWNYTVRLYRPKREILDGKWKFPTLSRA
jgi:hypothetical protein